MRREILKPRDYEYGIAPRTQRHPLSLAQQNWFDMATVLESSTLWK
jgi:hypothetical protein